VTVPGRLTVRLAARHIELAANSMAF
jgi:hypothetical protein